MNTMQVNILAFGIAKDIVRGSQLQLELPAGATVADLKERLCARFPDFERLASLRVAVNSEYVENSRTLAEQDEIVLIPPVSGG